MIERLKAMLVKEFIQVLRDPRMRFVMFVIPVVQTLIFGYAVNTDVREVATAVYDLDNSSQSREIADLFVKSGYFRLEARVYDDKKAQELIDRGEVKAVLRMNRGLSERLVGGRGAQLQMILDGTDSNTAGIALNYASRIVGGYNARLQEEWGARHGGVRTFPGGVELVSRAWFNENLESRNYYVPAVITNIVFIITMLLSSMAVVREKEIGTIEQVIVTPIGKGEFILGKSIPFILIGFINVTIISLVAVFWFEVPLRGSIPLLYLATALFLMSSLGIGLLISTISRTQQQAMMSAFFVLFPAILLSGFAFPIESMPQIVQWFTLVNPMRFFLVIIRAIFQKGVGVDILWPQMAALLLIGVTILSTAVLRFKKTLG
ncbi:ABC transporter permease [Citrifermentans bremense]|uniref:ABC transporter permease n=1 Tax=Citrifermentans bremense TaxID=60035 RepID=UPI00040BCD84|nr:ABC transporter permease [Citrifermentans bremense]